MTDPQGPQRPLSEWVHSICESCYIELNHPLVPVSADKAPISEGCCFCGGSHVSGLHVRRDPAKVRCGGLHQ